MQTHCMHVQQQCAVVKTRTVASDYLHLLGDRQRCAQTSDAARMLLLQGIQLGQIGNPDGSPQPHCRWFLLRL